MNWTFVVAILISALGVGVSYWQMELSPKSPRKLPSKREKEFRMPDMHFHYTADELYAILGEAGEAGRPLMRRYWLLDFGFILFFLGAMVSVSLNVAGYGTTLFWLMAGTSVARAVLDVAENSLLLVLQSACPDRKSGLAGLAGFVTSAKFVCLYAWVIILFYKLVGAAFHVA